MRVAIAKKLLSSVGGSELLSRGLAAALSARGHEVVLVAMRPAWRRPGIPIEAVAGGRDVVRSAENGIVHFYLPTRLGRLGRAIDGLLPTSLPDERAVVEVIRGFDVVHVVAREWAAAFERAGRRTGAAIVETPLVHPGQPFSGSGRADVARYRRDDAVIALTEWEASWYRERGVRRVHVTGAGPALTHLAEVPRDGATVLFVGRKERYKGYHALVAAAPLVWRERPETRFVAIGQRSWDPLGSRAPRDERWLELGVVDERRKAEAYARATVFAMPSEHETFGKTYLEAWAAGLPVIAGDIPPLREVVREGVDGLHSANEPRALSHAILRLLGDPELARRMGAAGRARLAELWTWPRVAERTEAAYADALTADRADPPLGLR